MYSASWSGSENERATISPSSKSCALVGCIFFGFLLFFTWPRINVLGSMADWLRPMHSSPGGSEGGKGIKVGNASNRGGFSEQFTAFNEEGVGLDEVGGLVQDDAPALNVTFTPIPSVWARPMTASTIAVDSSLVPRPPTKVRSIFKMSTRKRSRYRSEE